MPVRKGAQSAQVTESSSFAAPYPPSWFDRLKGWVDKLPIPPWLFYFGLAAVLGAAGPWVQWHEGAYPAGAFVPVSAWAFANGAYLLGFMHYIDRSASTAIDASRSLLGAERASAETSPSKGAPYELLAYQLTTLPSRPALFATLGGAVFALLAFLPVPGTASIPNLMAGAVRTPLSVAVLVAIFLPSNAMTVLFLYHSVRQLRLISHIYAHHAHINLYRLGPLYGLSTPGALTALALLVYPYLWWGAAYWAMGEVASAEIGFGVIISVVAIAIFALPLWGAHRRLVAEKKHHMSAVALRFEAATMQLHDQLDKGDLGGMDQLNRALSSLEIEQTALGRIPTWPWEAGTFRGILAAIVLPVAVWLVQILLGRLIGP